MTTNTAKETPMNIRLFDSSSSGLHGAILGLDTSEKVQQIFNSYLSCGMPIIKISSKGQAGFSKGCNGLIRKFVLNENPQQKEVDEFISEVETHINQTGELFERSLVYCDDFILLQRDERLAAFISRWMSTGGMWGLSVLIGSSDSDALNQLNSKFRDEISKYLWFVLTINEERQAMINQQGTIYVCDFEHVNFIAEWRNDRAIAKVELE
jgi:hypothetical protein